MRLTKEIKMWQTTDTGKEMRFAGFASIVLGALLFISLTLGACSPQTGKAGTSDGSDYVPNPNVTAIEGELPTVTAPDMTADGVGGSNIEGNEEEKLQQDRISGGSNSGGITSENLEPLTNSLIEPKDKRQD
jgi:hypothetical protein